MKDYTLITSRENAKLKNWTNLLAKKYRDRERLFLLEGELLIKDALESGGVIEELVISSSMTAPDKIIEKIWGGNAPEGVSIYMLSEELFRPLMDTENGRDILAVMRKPEWDFNSTDDTDGNSSLLILDKVQDPGNVGTIIRTCDGAGLGGIIAVKGTCDIFSPKVVRATAGSLFRIPVFFAEDAAEALEMARDRGLTVIAADARGEKDYWDAPLSSPIAIIIGNEGSGISEEFKNSSDTLVRIPMNGHIESLNAGISASIIVYEWLRQNSI